MPDTFEVICPGCGQRLRCKESSLGKRVACRHCGRHFTLPEPDPPVSDASRRFPLGWIGLVALLPTCTILMKLTLPGRVNTEHPVVFAVGYALMAMLMLLYLAGIVLSLIGAIWNRGQIGGALGFFLAVCVCILGAMVIGFRP